MTEYKCGICCKEFSSSRALKLHIIYKHKTKNYKPACCGWNKGKTKETDCRIAKQAKTFSDRFANGTHINHFKGKKHTLETKEKISKKALESDHRRLLKSTRNYKRKDGSIIKLDSSWEEALATRLDNLGVHWIRPNKPIYYVDNFGKKRRYYPDFFLPDYNLYLDPKNNHAYNVQKEKIDILNKIYNNIIWIRTLDECKKFNPIRP